MTASITHPADWTVDIKDSGSTVVKTFTGTGTSISVVWDGKDESEVLLPEGVYSFAITATEPGSGTTDTEESPNNITLDLTPPVAQITSPEAYEVVYETITITGTASDAAKLQHYINWGVGEYPESYPGGHWTVTLIDPYINVTGGTLGTWDTHNYLAVVENGINTIKLKVADKAGNVTEHMVPVNVLNAAVSDLTASVTFDPASNQSSAINYTLATGGFVTIRIGTEAAYFRTLVLDAKRPEGANTDYWDGRNDLGELVPAGDYIIAIWTVTDPDPMPITAPRITDPIATPPRFDPTTDAGATISYDLSKDAAVTVDIYDFDDNFIRNVVIDLSQSQGSNFVIWDGKNESGNNVYPGAYIYRIIATDSDPVTGPEITGIAQVYY